MLWTLPRTLLRRLGSDGQLDPAHATLANAMQAVASALCAVLLAKLAALGLVRSVCRLSRDS